MKKILNKMVIFEGMKKIEKLWLFDILITSFRKGIVGGSFLMLLNGTNIMLLVANATPIYFICNILSKKLKDKVAKSNDIFKLNLQLGLAGALTFIVTLTLAVLIDMRFLIINIILDYTIRPTQDAAGKYKDEKAKRLVFEDAQKYQEFDNKISHLSSMVSLAGYALNLGALGLVKLFGGLDIVTVCKILMLSGCVLTLLDELISIEEYKVLKELEMNESEPVIQ